MARLERGQGQGARGQGPGARGQGPGAMGQAWNGMGGKRVTLHSIAWHWKDMALKGKAKQGICQGMSTRVELSPPWNGKLQADLHIVLQPPWLTPLVTTGVAYSCFRQPAGCVLCIVKLHCFVCVCICTYIYILRINKQKTSDLLGSI